MGKFSNLKQVLLLAFISLFIVSCSSDEKKLNLNQLSLTAGQSSKLIYDGICTWSSDEPLIAEVDETGNVTANRVGETTIRANDETCLVKVNPQFHTYMEPCMNWGASEYEISNYMKGYQNLGKDDNTLSFSDYNNEFVYMYILENNSLSSSVIGTSFMKNGEEVIDFLMERYVPVEVDEASYTVIMVSIDKETVIGITFNAISGIMMVLYTPYSNITTTKSQCIQYKPLLNKSIQTETTQYNIEKLINKFRENSNQ